MIHFEIKQSPDQNVLTGFKYLQNLIYLGKKSGDLVIDDEHLRDSHVMIEVVEGNLLVHPQKGVEFYLINGKRTTTIRKLRIGDEVGIGQTVLRIQAFEHTLKETKAEVLNKKLKSMIAQGSERLGLIERLTKLMK
ncbi:MAG TPA: FHA domain-containing protein [Bacteriovoracaceae bacterium]|nr:FHA domain-containing protein [Bacteriovoracaceae bacterium]